MTARITSQGAANRLGVSRAVIDKLRNGQRLPSIEVLYRIVVGFDLDAMAALTACVRGAPVFAAYLRINVFRLPHQGDVGIVAGVTLLDVVQVAPVGYN
jgi:transcriptional regulator with XRE-family HTH domain